MTKKRIVGAAAAVALALGLGAGIAAAQTDPTTPSRPPAAGAMHDGGMGAMHAQTPEDMRAQCDTVHAEGSMTNATMNGSMMGGGMMGAGMMGAGMTSQR